MNTSASKGTALVTGASIGIGAHYAEQLAARGYDLILVARRTEPMQALAARIKAKGPTKVTVVQADLGTDAGNVAVEQILKSDSSITLLVNNAGIGSVLPILNADVRKMEEMITLNVTSLTRLTMAAAPAFAARGNGTIINISSIAAVMPELLNAVYGGSKAFVLAFSQALHKELAAKGVRIQAVLPGMTGTEFWGIAGLPQAHFEARDGMTMSAQDMVRASLSALDQGEVVTIPSLPDASDWHAYENARQALGPNLSHKKPAARFGV